MPAVPVRHGMFTWADLSTTDPDTASDFYRQVFGWDAEAMPAGDMGTYTMLRRNGGDIAGLGGQSPEMQAAGVPPAWNSYVTVDDVDAVTARARELGGHVLSEPFDVMDAGRMSVVQDPSGGVLCLWTARMHQGSAVFNEHGAITWNELATRDRDAAARFYGELLGWTWEKIDTPGGPYLMAMNGDRRNAGVLQMNEKWPADVPPHWMVYFFVDDLDASIERIRGAGGAVHVEPFDIGMGRIAVVADPQGAVFSLYNGRVDA